MKRVFLAMLIMACLVLGLDQTAFAIQGENKILLRPADKNLKVEDKQVKLLSAQAQNVHLGVYEFSHFAAVNPKDINPNESAFGAGNRSAY